ncbi:MAG TPA: acetyl-CoA hydrolase/transferase C-terminal domain-containing protein [Rhizomicrobium sp.]|jgi:acyl-CoA hydrolase|nr:acetyl-CoA hydrolase/transferase C-terminal domain-containing protein [Rhizomicrobium sp.]
MSAHFTDPEALADAVIAAVGRRIVLGLPLGLGKACHVANALYRRAARDPTLELHIFTALTLEAPGAKNELEKRFIGPISQRLLGGYPKLDYAAAVHGNALPPNIRVDEFFFLAGRWLGSETAQRSYISANYTHAADYLMARGVNVVAQLVAKKGERYSLSCNPDLTLDMLDAQKAGRAKFLLVGQVNSELPFMPGDGDLPAEAFSHVLESPATDFPLFAPPRQPLSATEHAIGLHIARLIADGGTLQIGIGEEGDAAVHAMILRHRRNEAFREAVSRLTGGAPPLAGEEGAPFALGLYGVSEMLVDGFLELIDAGILKREVDGVLVHGGFFVGPRAFYRRLREMAPDALARIQMTRISFTNQLYGDEAGKRAARVKARFVNSAMMATLLGAVVSDGLEDGRVVSGVGGQFNFVDQAFALEGARAIIAINATRGAGKRLQSNVRWAYGHTTVPRHLRDIVVSEYGIADLRGKSDEHVVARMLAIADSRFQGELLARAKDAGKIARAYEIPAAHRDNHPERIAAALAPLQAGGLLPDYPFGCDFTPVEQRLLPALERLQAASPRELARLALAGLGGGEDEALARMGLAAPNGLGERFYRALLRGALKG